MLLLVGGAGGYLLWRVNQQDTVAPTDSDAGLVVKEGGCTGEEIKITFYPYKSEEGELKYDSQLKVITPNEGEENNLELKLANSCAGEVTITATPKEGYTFKYWDDAARERKSTSPSMRVRYQDYADGKVNELRAVYGKGGEQGIESETETFVLTYEGFCPDYSGNANTLLTCLDPTGAGKISADTSCLNQKVKVGGDGLPVYIIKPKGEECEFRYWEIDGENVGEKNSHKIEGIKKDTTVKAIFERIYKGKNFSLKYSSKKEGDLKVDGSLVKAYPVTIQFTDGQPYPDVPEVEAVPKEGWLFEKWESNITTGVGDKTENPRHDTDRVVDLDIIAVYKKKEEEKPDPVDDTTPDPDTPSEKPTEKPVEKPKAPSSSEKKDNTEEKMPQTSAFSDRSLYIISIGALVLCLGMIWQYIPKDIFKRFKK